MHTSLQVYITSAVYNHKLFIASATGTNVINILWL